MRKQLRKAMQPIIKWKANQIHSRISSSKLAIEIILLKRQGYATTGLTTVLHHLLEGSVRPSINDLDLLREALDYYGKEYELPELEQ